MKIYFAGSIRGGRNDAELYAQMIRKLSEYGEVLTEHVGDKSLSAMGEDGPNDQYIYDRDVAWIKECDVMIAEVSTPSLGVGYEVATAEILGKKILCIDRPQEGKRLSAMIGGSGLAIKQYSSLEDLTKIFNQFFENRVQKERA